MATQVDLLGQDDEPRLLAAVATSYGYRGKQVYAAAVLYSYPELVLLEQCFAECPIRFPYIPGLIFYREGEVLLKALGDLQEQPDLIIVGGHGISHSRRCGLACQIGLCTECRAIGCARRLLVGRHAPVDITRGSSEPVMAGGREVAIAYRSRNSTKPILISPGYKCSLEFSCKIIVHCLRGSRLPEPMRAASKLAGGYKREVEKDIPRFDPNKKSYKARKVESN